jgi:MoxR-like ATPase
MLLFFETAENKAAGEKNVKMLGDIRSRMAGLYKSSGDYERAAQYYGVLLNSNPGLDKKEKEALLAELLDVYLSWPNMEQAERLINNRVLAEDLEPGNQFVNTIEFYLINPSAINDANSLLELLCQMEIPQDRPKWAEQIRKWSVQFVKTLPEPNMPEDSNEGY